MKNLWIVLVATGICAVTVHAKRTPENCIKKRNGTCFMWRYREGNHLVVTCDGPCVAKVKRGNRESVCTTKGTNVCTAKVRM